MSTPPTGPTEPVHSLTIGDVSRENRRRYPRELATVCCGTRLTYPDLDDRANRLANALRGAGVGVGDRVLWLGQNCHRVIELLVAASKIGAVLCPVNWRQSPRELAFVLEDASPKLVIGQRTEVGESLDEARALCDPSLPWLWSDDEGPGGYEDFMGAGSLHDDEALVDSSAAALMIYTAAFSGRPNGALLSSNALIGEAMLTAMVERLDHSDVYLNSGTFFHIGMWRYTLAMFLLGGRNVLIRRTDARELCRLVQEERCTGAYLFPLTQQQMVEACRDAHFDLSSLRRPPGSPEWNELVTLAATPWTEHPERYGQTEVGGIVTYGAFGPPPLGGHGRSSPLTQLRIVDDDGDEVDVGEIVIRGPLVMNGYHDRPEANASMLQDRWRRTNDVGRREEDGSITFLGSKTRMIKSGVENVYPAEVEAAVLSHPDVEDCAVIGVPDEVWTQAVKAVVVPREGCSLSADSVIAHCREQIAHYKAPRWVELVSTLPKSDGIVEYDVLDSRFGGRNYPGAGSSLGR